jgi:hypothetical protein
LKVQVEKGKVFFLMALPDCQIRQNGADLAICASQVWINRSK